MTTCVQVPWRGRRVGAAEVGAASYPGKSRIIEAAYHVDVRRLSVDVSDSPKPSKVVGGMISGVGALGLGSP